MGRRLPVMIALGAYTPLALTVTPPIASLRRVSYAPPAPCFIRGPVYLPQKLLPGLSAGESSYKRS